MAHDKFSTTVVCSFRYARCGFCYKIIGKVSRVCGENHVALQRVHTEPISGPNGIPFPKGHDSSRHDDLPPQFLAKNVMKKDVCMGFNVYDKSEFIFLFHFRKLKNSVLKLIVLPRGF